MSEIFGLLHLFIHLYVSITLLIWLVINWLSFLLVLFSSILWGFLQLFSVFSILLLLGDLSSESFNHHVKLDLVEVSTVIQIENFEKIFESSVISINSEGETNFVKAFSQLGFLKSVVRVEIELFEDLGTLLNILEVTLTDNNQKHELVDIQIPALVIVS